MHIVSLNDDLINEVINISRRAGDAILDVYNTDFDFSIKDDKSPLTEADTKSNTIIIEGLAKITPDVPVLSEEGQDIPY